MRPIAGAKLFNALRDQKRIILACNTRIDAGVILGIFRAAKEQDAALIMQLARSECNLDNGYTGFAPKLYSVACQQAADEAGVDIWVLHADHLSVKQGTPKEMQEIKALIHAQIQAGYTSFAIDASHLFNFQGKTVREELEPNIQATCELANFIKQEYGNNDFGLEVEVGEIGRKNEQGLVLTTAEEAVTFISALKEAGIEPHYLAIANGSTHGNTYNDQGQALEQETIDIKRTKEIGRALNKKGFSVKLAQHGTTGIPLLFIKKKFPRQYILKVNVGTLWMDLVWEVLKKSEPQLYQEIWDWTLRNYQEKNLGKRESEIFGQNSKFAIKEFKNRIDNLRPKTKQIIEKSAYQDAKKYFDALGAKGSAKIVMGF